MVIRHVSIFLIDKGFDLVETNVFDYCVDLSSPVPIITVYGCDVIDVVRG